MDTWEPCGVRLAPHQHELWTWISEISKISKIFILFIGIWFLWQRSPLSERRDEKIMPRSHFFNTNKSNCVFKSLHKMKNHAVGYYIGFYSSLKDKFEKMMILYFRQKMKRTGSICHVCIQSIFKSW